MIAPVDPLPPTTGALALDTYEATGASAASRRWTG